MNVLLALMTALSVLVVSSSSLAADLDLFPWDFEIPVRHTVVYGDDDRVDVYQADAFWIEKAQSTVALFQATSVRIDKVTDTAHLTTHLFGDQYDLCEEEPFREQKMGAFCSGSLVGPDLVLTAGHCIRDQASCDGTKFVFGFGIYHSGQTNDQVPGADVYSCGEVVQSTLGPNGTDWAVVRLDRAVVDRTPLSVRRNGDLEVRDPLVVIGHPSGLPTKVAGGANVRNLEQAFFRANLDTYGGNSGSAVFNKDTGEIEGILVRGEQDFTRDAARACTHTYYCSNDGCAGEDVTRVTEAVHHIPSL